MVVVVFDRPAADVRLICFCYAGGTAGLYSSIAKSLPAWIELCVVELPGRASLLMEKPLRDMAGVCLCVCVCVCMC
jgi:medium-chain acyl-[acyl-carrier-protein] hydrolase